ncbi:hypothetical protein [Sutterella sp.]|uniref:hypothetical protein n=1 Tax=Sutterella sp. TaxID=1981025 RepID=UPI0026DF0860|nr:hypothetical protein [Sutterella sp.]MDO5531843.1 hypothetical protein [Sutterella sp.]
MPKNSAPAGTRAAAEAAALAARLIAAESASWKSAFADARTATGAVPDAEAVAREIRRWFALFSPEAHARVLFEKRRAALELMRRVPELDLRLIGVVLSGEATERSPVELVTRAMGEKEAAITLLSAGLEAESFDTPWPTRFMRLRNSGSGGVRRDVITIATSVAGETLLVRVAPPHAPLPADEAPDETQTALESSGSLGAQGVSALLDEMRTTTASSFFVAQD